MKICDYGCKREALFQFKNGKWCCEEHPTKCPESRKKNSMSKIGRKHTEEEIIKMKNSMRGIPHLKARGMRKTAEHKKKISLSNREKKFTEEHKRKIGQTRLGQKHSKEAREKIRQGNLGKKVSKETRRKQRLSTIKRIEESIKNGGQLTPNYNPKGCKLIDEYGKLYGYSFQHAENGGEFHIKELGYWLDGYDKEKNVAVEIDELHHFNHGGDLSEKDAERQEEIEKFLDCTFVRLKIDRQ